MITALHFLMNHLLALESGILRKEYLYYTVKKHLLIGKTVKQSTLKFVYLYESQKNLDEFNYLQIPYSDSR